MRRGGQPSQARRASVVFTEPALCCPLNLTGMLPNDTIGLGSCWTRSGVSCADGSGACAPAARAVARHATSETATAYT
jgi:hypothetical protein